MGQSALIFLGVFFIAIGLVKGACALILRCREKEGSTDD